MLVDTVMVRSIEVARDGRHIAVRRATGLSILDLRGEAPAVELPIPGIHAFAAVADQWWVVAGAPAALVAYDVQGNALATASVCEPGATPRLVRAASLPLAAWLGSQTMIVAHDRALSVSTLATDVEFALPLSATRTIISSRQRLSLREQDTLRWTIPAAAFGTISDAAVVLDGKAVAIASTTPTHQSISVIGLRDGSLLHRFNVGSDHGIRFAPGRSVALLHTSDSRLVLVDLRFGRVLFDHQEPRPIAEAAIDQAGRDIALRFDDDPDSVVTIAVSKLVDAAAGGARAPVGDVPSEPVRSSAPAPSTSAATPVRSVEAGAPLGSAEVDAPAEPAVAPFDTGGSTLACSALPPRPPIEATTAAETAMLHERHRELVIALVGVAIARAWDEGRLAYPQTQGLPFHSEVSGVTAGQRGLATEELVAAQRRAETAVAAARAARKAVQPRRGPLDALGEELGLSPVARDLVLLVAAPSLWGETARLYGILSNDEGRPLVDEYLLGDLLLGQATREQIARELDHDAPLVRYGVIRVQAGALRPFLPLVVDPVVLRMLRGVALDAELQPLVQTRAAERTFEELQIPTAAKHAIAAELARAASPLRIVVRGRLGSGRHTLLAAIAAMSRRELGVIDATSLVRGGRIAELGIALERAHMAGLLPCVDGLEQIPSHDVAARDHVREVLRGHAGPLAVRLPLDVQAPLDPGYALLDLPALTLTERLTCWQSALSRAGLRVAELEELGVRYAIGPGVIERVVTDVARTSEGATANAGPRIEASIRQHLEDRLGAIATRVTRLATWQQVILPPDIEDSLTELIARIKHRRIVFDTWGFDRLLTSSRGVTALFSGGPGTGKTLVASAIANELGMDLYRVDLSRVMSKWIGETEQNLAKLFDAAEDGNTIILFDEADSLFAKRTEVKSSVDRYANLEVNYLLQRIDSFEGIAILTTNFGTAIDSAFKRRLSLRLTFPFPDEEMREKLWRAHLPAHVPKAGTFDFAELSRRYQMSGGYIRNAALRAAFLAAEEHSPVTQDHLERAIKAEFREIGKIAESGILE